MPAIIKQIHPAFIGEVSGIDLREPLTSKKVKLINEGMAKHGGLIFFNQNITDKQQRESSRNFEKLERLGQVSSVVKEED